MSALKLRDGERVTLHPDNEFGVKADVIVGRSYGYAEVRAVYNPERTKTGLIAVKPNGSWWWVRHLTPFTPEDGS